VLKIGHDILLGLPKLPFLFIVSNWKSYNNATSSKKYRNETINYMFVLYMNL